MASDDVSITIDNNLDITEPSARASSLSPNFEDGPTISAPKNGRAPAPAPCSAIDRPSEEVMASNDVNITVDSNSDITAPYSSSLSPGYAGSSSASGLLRAWRYFANSRPFKKVMASDDTIKSPRSIPCSCFPSSDYDRRKLKRRARRAPISRPLTKEKKEMAPDSSVKTLSAEAAGIHQLRSNHPQWSVADANSWKFRRVPRRVREVNEKAYEPNVISIGPYHYANGYDKEHLRAMEVIKRSCFSKIVDKTKLVFRDFEEAMKPFRKCYGEPFGLNSDQFVEMMVYDGCFIVQLIRKIHPEDDIFKLKHIQTDIRYDLLLLENQLPFFVLFNLYCKIMPNGGGGLVEFVRSSISIFKIEGHGPEIWSGSENCPSPEKDIKHLLDLVHNCCRPSPGGIKQHQDFKAKAAEAEAKAKAEAEAKEPKSQRSWKFIRSATELKEAGINFFGEKVQQSLFDIIFTQDTKVLKIPTLHVDDNTERILRNLMAYEQFIPSGEPTYVSDYVVFMDNLINTGKDVQILCNSGVIDNWLGDDEAVAQMFNKLRDFICSSDDFFYYAEIFGRVNEHCARKWNKYKAKLKKDYFNSPWSFISFLAAVFLLLLTLLQTIFSVLSYFHQ